MDSGANMQTEALSVDALFMPDRGFRTPLFQRRYIWTETDQQAPYWADVERQARVAFKWFQGNRPSLYERNSITGRSAIA